MCATTGGGACWRCWRVLVVVTAAVLAALMGRRVFADTFAALAVLDNVRRLPHWSKDAAVASAAAAAVLGTYALAFGRRRIVVIACVALLVGLFAAPGVALGWASAYVGQMGSAGTAEQRSTVAGAQSVLQHPLPYKPVNILLLGIDHAGPGDPGRSDSQILVRLDPQSHTISMLSLPRDLRWRCAGPGLHEDERRLHLRRRQARREDVLADHGAAHQPLRARGLQRLLAHRRSAARRVPAGGPLLLQHRG